MKILCDACEKDGASVFCSADEAALCAACDHCVHHANKLAVKHHRHSLLVPDSSNSSSSSSSTSSLPLCDVCQERRAFLFCQEDRAILCRDCDVPIHTRNAHTQTHSRFLLTGVKLSSPVASETNDKNSFSDRGSSKPQKQQKPISVASPKVPHPQQQPIAPEQETTSTTSTSETTAADTANISEYLMEMLPGWRVDDFLDSPDYCPYDFSKNDDAGLGFLDSDFEGSLGSLSTESFGIWVPQAPPPPPQVPQYFSQAGGGQVAGGLKELKIPSSLKKTNRLSRDEAFTVPQISPSTGSKRSRKF